MTAQSNSNSGGAALTPAEILAVHRKFISGETITDAEMVVENSILLAASFGAEAFVRYPGCEGGATNAMLSAFLTALVDPLDPDLDYLRTDPASGTVARAARPSATEGSDA